MNLPFLMYHFFGESNTSQQGEILREHLGSPGTFGPFAANHEVLQGTHIAYGRCCRGFFRDAQRSVASKKQTFTSMVFDITNGWADGVTL